MYPQVGTLKSWGNILTNKHLTNFSGVFWHLKFSAYPWVYGKYMECKELSQSVKSLSNDGNYMNTICTQSIGIHRSPFARSSGLILAIQFWAFEQDLSLAFLPSPFYKPITAMYLYTYICVEPTLKN